MRLLLAREEVGDRGAHIPNVVRSRIGEHARRSSAAYHRTAITIISHVHTIAGYAQLVRDKLEEDLTVLLVLFSTNFAYACL
jgi:hypothetical protein